MTIVTYDKFREDAARMFEGAVESAYKDLLEKAVAEAVAAEREACAKVCDAESETSEVAAFAGHFPIRQNGIVARRCAAAIRARTP